MKKLIQAVAVSVVIMGALSGLAAADAAVSCTGNISNTGPGSHNSVTCSDKTVTSVSCDNNVVVDNSNSQGANSGKAFTAGNTSGGNSQSGGSSNSNSSTFTLGESCSLVSTTATTPPAGGSGGQVQGASTAAPQVVAPAGAVGAGAGAGVASNKTAAFAGLIGSVSAVSIGLALKKRAFGRN